MRPLDSYLGPAGSATDTHGVRVDATVRAQIAEALRKREVVDGVLAALKVPGLVKAVVRPYVVRALAFVADWVDSVPAAL